MFYEIVSFQCLVKSIRRLIYPKICVYLSKEYDNFSGMFPRPMTFLGFCNNDEMMILSVYEDR